MSLRIQFASSVGTGSGKESTEGGGDNIGEVGRDGRFINFARVELLLSLKAPPVWICRSVGRVWYREEYPGDSMTGECLGIGGPRNTSSCEGIELIEPVDETEPTLCLELSIGGVMEGWRYGVSMVWPRGRTGEGLGGGLEEALSSELGKASLKTIPCLRVPPGVVALGITPPAPATFGMDLGGDAGADIEPRPRGKGPPGRAVAVFLGEGEEEELFMAMSFCACGCAARSVGSGVTARTVARGLVREVGLATAGRYVAMVVVLRRLPAEVLRGMASAARPGKPAPAPAPAPVAVAVAVAMAAAAAEAEDGDLVKSRSRSRVRWAAAKMGSKVCRRGTDGREADGRRGRGGGREAS